jgi:hypothetical protein
MSEMVPIGIIGNMTELADILCCEIRCLPMNYLRMYWGSFSIEINMESYSREVGVHLRMYWGSFSIEINMESYSREVGP